MHDLIFLYFHTGRSQTSINRQHLLFLLDDYRQRDSHRWIHSFLSGRFAKWNEWPTRAIFGSSCSSFSYQILSILLLLDYKGFKLTSTDPMGRPPERLACQHFWYSYQCWWCQVEMVDRWVKPYFPDFVFFGRKKVSDTLCIFSDPMGAMIIAVGVITSWTITGYQEFSTLIGKNADLDFQRFIVYKAMTFSDDFIAIEWALTPNCSWPYC